MPAGSLTVETIPAARRFVHLRSRWLARCPRLVWVIDLFGIAVVRRLARAQIEVVLAGRRPSRGIEWGVESHELEIADAVCAAIQRTARWSSKEFRPEDEIGLAVECIFDGLAEVSLLQNLELIMGVSVSGSAAGGCATVGELVTAVKGIVHGSSRHG